MLTTLLGRAGVEVSRLGLGCNNFGRSFGHVDAAGARAIVEAALDEGVSFFDTADRYGRAGQSEIFLGEALKGNRERVVLATKFGLDASYERAPSPRGSREYVRFAAEHSLRRLQTDYIDLYYYHRPDGLTPLEETLGAMEELVVEGKIRQIGCSGLDLQQLEHAARCAPLAALENEYSLLNRSVELSILPRCRELGIALVPFFPLASGLLTGKYRRDELAPIWSRLEGDEQLTARTFDKLERLESFAADRGRTLLELAIGALASEPGVSSIIAGATQPEQLRANAAASSWVMSAEERDAVRALAIESEPTRWEASVARADARWSS